MTIAERIRRRLAIWRDNTDHHPQMRSYITLTAWAIAHGKTFKVFRAKGIES